MIDENQKLIDEIISVSHRSKTPELYKSSCDSLIIATAKLVEVYNEQKKKTARIEKNNATFLRQVDKRNIVQNATSTKKDMMLKQQSKMAAMGEMMDAVAHQWKQPLNSLTMMNDMLVDDFKDGLVDVEYINDMAETSHMQISHMVNTLNEFRTFFRPSKNADNFLIKDCVSSVEVLMKDELIKNNINLKVEIKDNISIYGFINEFKHLFLNLLSNSIDAFNEKKVQQREIVIQAYTQSDKNIIEFKDNALGIPKRVIADIFKPNVTTKQDGKGTGIGLYMSSQIVKKHNGLINVQNTQDGAIFTIIIKN